MQETTLNQPAGAGAKAALKAMLGPIVKASGLYVWELVRGVAAGLVVCALGYAVLHWLMPTPEAGLRDMPRFVGAAMCGLLLPLLYAFVAHLRGTKRVFAEVAHVAAGPLFDRTVAPFIESMERKKPGTMVEMVRKPGEWAESARRFVKGDSENPAMVRRLGARMIGYLARELAESDSVPQGLVADGRFYMPAFREWSLAQLREVVGPDWDLFFIVLGAQVVAMGGLIWWAR